MSSKKNFMYPSGILKKDLKKKKIPKSWELKYLFLFVSLFTFFFFFPWEILFTNKIIKIKPSD